MVSLHLLACVALSVVSPALARPGFGSDLLVPSTRRLQQNGPQSATKVRVVDFATLKTNGDQRVGEKELKGRINVTDSTEPVQYGAYFLGPDQVAQLNHTIATELVRLAPPSLVCVHFWLPGFNVAAMICMVAACARVRKPRHKHLITWLARFRMSPWVLERIMVAFVAAMRAGSR